MMAPTRLCWPLALVLAALAAAPAALAQPVLDQALADAQLAETKGCAVLRVNFNIRIRYASHFPIASGDELRITVNAIDRDQAAALMKIRREATRVPNAGRAAIKSIVLETDHPNGLVLRIQFDRPVTYQVAPDPDPRGIVVAIAGKGPSTTCRPIFPGPTGATLAPPRAGDNRGGPARMKERPAGRISDTDLRSVAAWMDEGRAALRKNDHHGAIQLFTRILNYPENQYSAEAQELLGLARQKNGQGAQARTEYEDYLRRYPAGEGNERVRQRLAGILTASGEAGERLRMPNAPRLGGDKATRNGQTAWTFSGSASVFYTRDDSFRTVRDPTVAPNPTADPDTHRVHQNQLLTNLDTIATWNNDQTRGKIRFSGSQEHGFDTQRDVYGVASMFIDAQVKDWNLRTVVGRQTLATDGVLGRFDGALLSWQAFPSIRFDLVGGSPAVSRFDLPLKDDKYFYGAAIGFGPFLGGFETTLYAIEQRDRWLIDRRAVGAEVRYFDKDRFAFGTVDYDVHFQQLNAAIFSGSWTLFDKSTIYGGADIRRTPYLSSWNALLNQPFATLYDMMRFQTSAQIQQLAVDQTPTYRSAMLGYSHPFSDKFQVSVDATVVNLTQPIVATPGIDPALAALPSGNEYYFSTQFIGSNLFKDGDMYVAALRYSQMMTANMYVVDFNTRYPLLRDLRISPRLRLGYRVGSGIDLKEYTVLPSVLIDYNWTTNLKFELEVGTQWNRTMQAGITSTDTELFFTFGARYDFYADDSAKLADSAAKCKTPAPVVSALCRFSTDPDRNCSAPPPSCP